MSIPIYTTNKEPEDYTQFSMTVASVWNLYDLGKLSPEEGWLLNVLYKKVNPYKGWGKTSHTELCVAMQMKPTPAKVNRITKMMRRLKKHELVWFPKHSGSRGFEYVVAKFKFGKLQEKETDKWIDITPYFSSRNQNTGRGENRTFTNPSPEPVQREQPQEQRFQRSETGSFTRISDELSKRFGRGSQTDTETQT